jgi:putative transposase
MDRYLKGIKIAPNEIVSYLGENYKISEILNLEEVLLKNLKDHSITNAAIKDLSIPIEDIKEESTNKISELNEIDDNYWEIAQNRFSAIRPILADRGNIKLIKAQAKAYSVDQSTIYRWIEKYEMTGKISSLVPQKRGSIKGESTRLDEKVEAIIKNSVSNIYLSKQKSSIRKVFRDIYQKCKNANLDKPHILTVRNRILKLVPRDVAKARLGIKVVDELYEPLKGHFPGADYPLSIVQIDHTKLDIILVDEKYRIAIGKPWITLAIDVFSRMVTGFYISFDPPGSTGTGMCIAHSILPKDIWLSKNNVVGEWPCWGVLRKIHLDNAKEFHGKSLQRSCDEYSIEIKWRLRKKPKYGGHIEKLLGTFSKEIHELPGTTFSNPKQRQNYNSEKEATFTLSELENWLTEYIVNIYHKRIHKGIGKSPLMKYTEGIFGTGEIPGIGIPKRIFDDRKLKLDFLPFEERTIQQYGLVIDHIHYYGDALRKWINYVDFGTGKAKIKKKFIFKIDPRDISVVFFYDPDIKEYLEIPYRDTSKPPMTRWEYNVVINKLKEEDKNIDENAIFEAYERMSKIEQDSISKTKRARRYMKDIKAEHSLRKSLRQEFKEQNNNLEDDNTNLIIKTPKEKIKPFEDIDI